MNIKSIIALTAVLCCAVQVNTFADGAVIGEVTWVTAEEKIGTEAELRAFAAKVNAGDDYSGKTVKLTNDIVLDGTVDWVPIGNGETTPFKGKFDGGHHVIKNLSQTDTDGPLYGLFGYVKDGEIKNVKADNVTLEASAYCTDGSGNALPVVLGCIASVAENSSFEHCNVLGGSIKTVSEGLKYNDIYYAAAGGVVGYTSAARFECCSNNADIYTNVRAGGITVSLGDKTGSMKYCFNSGNISCTDNMTNVGGLAQENVGSITYCYNSGSVTSTGVFASGFVTSNASNAVLENCVDFNTTNRGYTVNFGTMKLLTYTNQDDDYKIVTVSSTAVSAITKLADIYTPYRHMQSLNYDEELYALAVDTVHPVFMWEALYNNGRRLRGDMNGDGHFSPKDAAFMLKGITGAYSAETAALADADADGKADMLDVMAIQKRSSYSDVYDKGE